MNTAFEREAQKEEWLTPRHIIEALAPFDLDPCASVIQPWKTASLTYTIHDNGLLKRWEKAGSMEKPFVWCNPPYGNQTRHWFKRMAEHNHGIALTFARTETKMFFESVWPKARCVLFIEARLSFCDVTGKAIGSAGAPSVLIGYGIESMSRLLHAARTKSIQGKIVEL